MLKIKRNKPLLGTFVEITAFTSNNLSEDDVSNIIQQCYTYISRLQSIFSRHDSNSQLSQLNNYGFLNNAAPELIRLLKISKKISGITDGIFDVSSPFGLSGNYTDISISNNNIKFMRDLKIDLGGIAKGFIVDMASQFLINSGIKNAVINAGGDMKIFGTMSQEVHIRHPFNVREYIDLGKLANCSIATSTITKESKDRGGKSQAILHKLLPQTNSNIIHASVISYHKKFSCTFADALTKPTILNWTPNLTKIKYLSFNTNGKIIQNLYDL